MKDLKPVGVKAPLSLLPRGPLCAISAAIEHGAVKYAPWNWQDTTQAQARIEELHNALLRHILASSDPSQGNEDDESGLHHLAHAGACILILLYKLGIEYQPSKYITDQTKWETYEPAMTQAPIFTRGAVVVDPEVVKNLKHGEWDTLPNPLKGHEEDPQYLMAREMAEKAKDLYEKGTNLDEVARRLYQLLLSEEECP